MELARRKVPLRPLLLSPSLAPPRADPSVTPAATVQVLLQHSRRQAGKHGGALQGPHVGRLPPDRLPHLPLLLLSRLRPPRRHARRRPLRRQRKVVRGVARHFRDTSSRRFLEMLPRHFRGRLSRATLSQWHAEPFEARPALERSPPPLFLRRRSRRTRPPSPSSRRSPPPSPPRASLETGATSSRAGPTPRPRPLQAEGSDTPRTSPLAAGATTSPCASGMCG